MSKRKKIMSEKDRKKGVVGAVIHAMKLHEGTVGKTYVVRSVLVDEKITRRLEALGVNELTPLVLMNKKGSGTVIIKIRGTRLALGRRIAEGIEVTEGTER